MIKIGNVEIENSFALAPMAAINCTSFRLMCKRHNAGLIYTQMIDSDKMANKSSDEIKEFLNILDEERPVSIQIVGSNTQNMINVAKLVEQFADIIDINMGCILPDYIKRVCGAALLRDLSKIEEIATAIVNSVSIPVTAKIRIGWDSQTINAVKVCRLLEKCGVSAIAIHGRTAEQKYKGNINWAMMKQIKSLVKIPIIANGNVTYYKEGLELLQKTNCDMVMIGRRAMHAPWVFNNEFKITNENVKAELLEFVRLYEKYENRSSLNEIREHIFWMFEDIKTKRNPRDIHNLKSVDEIKRFIREA